MRERDPMQDNRIYDSIEKIKTYLNKGIWLALGLLKEETQPNQSTHFETQTNESLNYKKFVYPDLNIENVPNLRRQLAEDYQAFISKTAYRLMEKHGIKESDVAVVVSGGIGLKTSTAKSDVDIDVIQFNSSIDISDFEMELFLELLQLGNSIDPYITKELCHNSDEIGHKLMDSMSALYQNGMLDDKRSQLESILAVLKPVSRNADVVYNSIIENLPPLIGYQKAFLGCRLLAGNQEALDQLISNTESYISKKSDIDAQEIQRILDVSHDYITSPRSLIDNEPKFIVGHILKLLRLEYLQEEGRFCSSYEDLAIFAKRFGEEFVDAIEFFINYRFLMANYKLLNPELTNKTFIEDEEFLCLLAKASGCSSVNELENMAKNHFKYIDLFLKEIIKRVEDRTKLV